MSAPGNDSDAGAAPAGQPSTAMVSAEGPHNPYLEAKKTLVVSNSAASSVLATSKMRTKMHDPTNLVELARFVQQADSHTKSIVGGKLELISEQIKLLQSQARNVLENAQRDLSLSNAKCNFQRKPGNTYHLYRKEVNGMEEHFFSMLSPLEWGGKPPNEYVDSYRLEYDMSWTQVDRIVERDEKRKFDPMILGLTETQIADSTQHLSLTMV
eukprot:m.281011 g.281011  ORF g.281011 m.281011 type:complete len:212 (-) comp16171_c0_seq3:4372-5007(-)